MSYQRKISYEISGNKRKEADFFLSFKNVFREPYVRKMIGESNPKNQDNFSNSMEIRQQPVPLLFNFSNIGVQRIQAKLRINQHGDMYEKEADRIANEVVNDRISFESYIPGIPGNKQSNRIYKGFHAVNREKENIGSKKENVNSFNEITRPRYIVNSITDGLGQSGTSIDPLTRKLMESRFGFDFSHVRVHTDDRAAESAHSVNALAYTVGNNIVFGKGNYQPSMLEGKRLLAHELTHSLQQSNSGPRHADSKAHISISRTDKMIQRSELDPDELSSMNKEDQAIEERAKQALRSGEPEFKVHEIMWRLIRNHRLDLHFELSGSRYSKAQKGVHVELQGKGPRTTGTLVGGDDLLQRVANGQVADIAKEIKAQIGLIDTSRGTIDYVFIMGSDVPKSNNKFYTEAKRFFKAEHPQAIMIEDVRSLDGINQRINSENRPVANLHIVSHAHPDGTLQFSINEADKTPGQVQYSELKEANDKQSLTQPKQDLVGFWTSVMIHGCNLGRSEEMLVETSKAFGGEVRVIAPTHEQAYGGTKESMAGPYYEEPGISNLSDDQAFNLIKAKPEYSFITDWNAMRSKLNPFKQSIPEIVYEGKFPEKGKELDFLKAERGAITAKNYNFDSMHVEGKDTVFTFVAKDPTKMGNTIIIMETPPDDKTAIQKARDTVARPDSYAYKVRRVRHGLNLSVTVDIQRSEWVLYHAEMHKQGKGFNPSPGTKPWYADTDNP